MHEHVDILQEPRGETYASLLRFAPSRAALVSLVWREGVAFGPGAQAVTDELRPELLHEQRTNAWPGTQLLGGLGIVRFYRMSAISSSTLASAGSLYAWLAPDRPEDLAFYVEVDRPWLGSIAHERDAFLDPDVVDLDDLVEQVPGLTLGHVGDR